MLRRKRQSAKPAMTELLAQWSRRVRHIVVGLVFVVTTASAGVLSADYLMRPGVLPFTRLIVEGEFLHVSRNDVRDAIKPAVAAGFFASDMDAVKGAVLELPWVQWVAVRREWPDTLRVRIIEQRAVAQWADGGLVNDRGQLFRPHEKSYPAGLPVLSGPDGTTPQVASLYGQLSRQLGMVNLNVTSVQLDARRAWSVQLDSGIKIVLGRQLERNRMQRFIRAYPRALAMRLHEVEQIDLRYPNGFAVRWKDAPQAQSPSEHSVS